MTTFSTSEEALWGSARDGDHQAFGRVFDLHRVRVFRHARLLVESVHDAEDITAIVFLETWRRRQDVRVVDGSIAGWLLVTTNFVARNARRSRRRFQELIVRMRSMPDVVDEFDDVDSRLDTAAAAKHLHRTLADLPKRDQDVITLCIVQGMSTALASEVLKVPAGTVKSRLSRARRRLAQNLDGIGLDIITSGGDE